MYEHCGFLGFFSKSASDENVKKAAAELSICGKGTFWDANTLKCVAINEGFDKYEIVQRSGKCECDGIPSLVRTKTSCEASGPKCIWSEWEKTEGILFDVDII